MESMDNLKQMPLLLADIGNTHVHIYDGSTVEHLSYLDALKQYASTPLYYICVKQQLLEEIGLVTAWKNLSSFIEIEGEYPTMGVDRKALSLSRKEGVFVDAGSAITVDVVEEGVYKGGFILAGLQASLEAYGRISPALATTLERGLCLKSLPTTTKEQISYGIIASIKALIKQHSKGKPLYFTGGDGLFLSRYFDGATYDETLVFQGMIKSMKDKKLC